MMPIKKVYIVTFEITAVSAFFTGVCSTVLHDPIGMCMPGSNDWEHSPTSLSNALLVPGINGFGTF